MNAVSGTVTVIALSVPRSFRIATIPVGTEPRGCATSPSRKLLFVANQTAGTVSVIDTRSRSVVETVNVGGRPTAVAVTNDGDKDDSDETVFVTDFYAEPIPAGPGEAFDDGKQGVGTSSPLPPRARRDARTDRERRVPRAIVRVLKQSIWRDDRDLPRQRHFSPYQEPTRWRR